MAKVKAELDDIQEDLKQAINILKEQVKKSHQSGNAMFFKEAIEGIPEFDGSTVPIKKWLQEIDDNAIIFGWTDLHALVVAKKLLTGVAKLWLRSQPTFSTWPELKEAITNEFDNPIDSRNIHIF
ncbi:transposition [Cordylochernes scorpioides]|uniref:Transposition n=1 Tax=Cordylochernes scorpioides TaxID=51811 RepID=A0ABY6L0B6_9ARAC|nr:transposition [Cordylochernes scorpioides]